MSLELHYSAKLPKGTTQVLIPGGVATPHGSVVQVEVADALTTDAVETTTGQRLVLATPTGSILTVTWHAESNGDDRYPERMFVPTESRYTRVADELVAEVVDAVAGTAGLDRARAVARHTAERFTYGHVETSFNEGLDEIPALGCGLTEGSCVDINTYFIAALRAAGIEAGYATGFFFPAEKDGSCSDGHCWVVTRIDDEFQEWDIAHHLKMGTRDIQPALNPKPGRRIACAHSMGLDVPEVGVHGLKALIEPGSLVDGRLVWFDEPVIRLVERARANVGP